MVSANRVVDFLQTDRIGIEHRAATVGRKTIAIDLDDIDIAGP